ncbi:protein PFC0760c-like isoform X2 [Orbicella faveolata]|uniref:protein PFC0760c-like isoform X2 n=1 Tax=Orbicella faveolata TaxID=48498 RepID=UPI0009E44703|nr:protein PFC0760c-like isoform X2 [Orbicella faveolata]
MLANGHVKEAKLLLVFRSGWAPLLLTLMYEYTNPSSHWKPYLNLVPDVTVLDQPMFWALEERHKELQGTGIEEDVESDVQHIEEEYNVIVLPFIKKHPELFSESLHTVTLYKHMAAFVMAYSFTEQDSSKYDDDDDDDEEEEEEEEDDDDIAEVKSNDSVPAMVPMADILNHISNHNAHLEFGAESLTMVATQDIHKGQEIFNTYGKLANCHLLQTYGFVEDELPNSYDMVDIPISAFNEVMKVSQAHQARGMLNAKFEFMEEMGVASEDDVFPFGQDGCSHFGPDLYATLRILHLSEGQFKQLLEEQIQQKRSEEFDDIGHVLDQPDEEIKKDTSWRILELIYKAENKNTKRKRQTADKDSDRKQKKRKNIQCDFTLDSGPRIKSEDCNLTVSLEMNSPSTTHGDGVLPYLNDTLKTNSIVSKQNESKTKSQKLSRTDLDTNADTSKDMSKTSKQDLTKTGGGTCDVENAGNDKVSDDECENSDIDDGDDQNCNINDGDDDDDDDDDEDNDVDYDDDRDDNDEDEDDDDEDGYEPPDDDDDNVDDQEESEQPITYDTMSQWPIEWRRTLKSVAELCVKQRYGDDNMFRYDSTEKQKLSKRQLSVVRLKQGQRSIFRRICELVVEDSSEG